MKLFFIIDKNRSWGNNLDIGFISKKVLELSEGREIVPEETRWSDYPNNIRNLRFLDLRNSFKQDCKYFVLFGYSATERIHSKFFDQVENIEIVKFKGVAHDVANYLKSKDLLNSLITGCLSDGLGLKAILANKDIAFD